LRLKANEIFLSLKLRLKSYKARMNNWDSITEFCKKAINNYRNNIKAEKKNLAKSYQKMRYGKMYTITLYTF
jgi:hypothetical protein